MDFQISYAQPGDATAVREFLENLSPDARWLRYHSPIPIVRSWMVDAVVRTDHEHRAALIATHDGRVVGVAEWGRYNAQDPTADVAVVVDDGFRRRGVAQELLRHLSADARAHGIDSFTASVLSVNQPTIGLLQRVAPERSTRFDGSTVEVLIPLTQSA